MQNLANVQYTSKLLSLTRIYSLGNVLLITLLALSVGSGRVVVDAQFFLVSAMGLLFWTSCVFLLDFFHRAIDGRDDLINKYVLLVPVILLIAILALTAPIAILFFIVAFITVKLYSMKANDLSVSHVLFIFRPFTEIGIIYSAAAMYKYSLSDPRLVLISAMVYLISVSRNLIGDIRDVKFDKYTLANKVGRDGTYLFSLAFILILCLVVGQSYALIPLVVVGVLILLRIHPYFLHQMYVLCTSFFLALLLLASGQSPTLIVVLLFISVILNFTYDITPRKSNADKPRL